MAEKKPYEPFSHPCGARDWQMVKAAYDSPTSEEALGWNDFSFATLEGASFSWGYRLTVLDVTSMLYPPTDYGGTDG